MVAPHAVTCHIKVEVRGPNDEKTNADIPQIINVLKDANYKGFVSIEYESEEDPKTGVPKFTRIIQNALR